MPTRKRLDNYGLSSLPTIHDLIAAIRSDMTLRKQRREDICAALRELAKLAGKRPRELPASPSVLQELIAASALPPARYPPSRVSCLRRLLRSAMERAGIAHLKGKCSAPLSADWRSLAEALTSTRDRRALSRFFHFASDRALALSAVSQCTFDDYLICLISDSLIVDVKRGYSNTCRAWNRVRQLVDIWPRFIVLEPDATTTYSLSWKDFQKSLIDDVEAYLGSISVDSDERQNVQLSVRPDTIIRLRQAIRSFASAIVRGGKDVSDLKTLADVVDAKSVRSGLDFLLIRFRGRVSTQMRNLIALVVAIARHWVEVSPDHLQHLKSLHGRLRLKVGATDKSQSSIMKQFDSPENVYALITLPEKLMSGLRTAGKGKLRAAQVVQTAVAIELLLMAPIRSSELCGIALGRGLVSSRKGSMKLKFDRSGRRGAMSWTVGLRKDTSNLIRLYLDQHKRNLQLGKSEWLFPGRNGKQKSTEQMRSQVSKCILEQLGLIMTPDRFRDFAAKHYLESHPGDYHVLRFALAHRSAQTTQDRFMHIDGTTAFRTADRLFSGRMRASAAIGLA